MKDISQFESFLYYQRVYSTHLKFAKDSEPDWMYDALQDGYM